MKKTTRYGRNLAICVMIALAGLLLIYVGGALFDFRMEVGYDAPKNSFLVVLGAIGIILIENVPMALGGLLLIIGAIGVFNNAKRLMR